MPEGSEKNKGGRPPEEEVSLRWKAIAEKFESYIEDTEIPIAAEFAYQNRIFREDLYKRPETQEALKRCLAKKETALERKSLLGQVNTTQAIFSLKQMGWSDRHEIGGINGGSPIKTESVTKITFVRPEKRDA